MSSGGRHPAEVPTPERSILDQNVQAIARWEQAALHQRSRTEKFADWMTGAAATGQMLALHLAWFGCWAVVNSGYIQAITPFDPFPFPLLTTMVALESIFLAVLVLASQNRLSVQADKRAHLNLQIDLLAEQEMTIVLQLLQDVARKLDVKTDATAGLMRELLTKTDIHRLADKVDSATSAPTANDQGSA